jgi:hypothetical protein
MTLFRKTTVNGQTTTEVFEYQGRQWEGPEELHPTVFVVRPKRARKLHKGMISGNPPNGATLPCSWAKYAEGDYVLVEKIQNNPEWHALSGFDVRPWLESRYPDADICQRCWPVRELPSWSRA